MFARINSSFFAFFIKRDADSHGNRRRGNFRGDLNKSEILQEFLDISVYPQLLKREGWNYTRIYDKGLQNSGIDLILETDRGSLNVDEKAQIEYLDNKNIPTVAFEISYFKDGLPHVGWLFDPQKKTDLIFYVTSIKTKSGKGEFKTSADLLSCEILSVQLASLTKALLSVGLDFKRCTSIFETKNINGEVLLRQFGNSKLKRSVQKAESPLNLVIYRSTLQNILKQGCTKVW